MAESVKARAIVARQPLDKGKWSLEEVRTRSHLEADEVLVEMVGSGTLIHPFSSSFDHSRITIPVPLQHHPEWRNHEANTVNIPGICHTDILLGTFKEDNELARYPRILGHEGSGHVRAVGSAVKNLSEGDPVLLSFSFCNECYACSAGHRSYCKDFNDINFVGREGAFTDSKGEQVCGSFFGQSSFASFSVVRESSIVNVKGLVNDEKELALFSPLGCGLQTGAGTVLNASGAGEKDVLLVSGLGGVGLAAVMGAKIAGCRIVVGVDRVKNRLDRAKELGATHVINTDELGGKSIADAIKAVTEGVGPTS